MAEQLPLFDDPYATRDIECLTNARNLLRDAAAGRLEDVHDLATLARIRAQAEQCQRFAQEAVNRAMYGLGTILRGAS